MDIAVTVSFWFIVSLCLVSLVTGMFFGGCIAANRYRY